MSDYDDDETKKDQTWTKFRPALKFTKEMYDATVRQNTQLRDSYIKTQSDILVFMGKQEEADEAKKVKDEAEGMGFLNF